MITSLLTAATDEPGSVPVTSIVYAPEGRSVMLAWSWGIRGNRVSTSRSVPMVMGDLHRVIVGKVHVDGRVVP